MFVSTKDTYSENRKAEIKNHNLPILQFMYNGSKRRQLKCVISGTPGFVSFPDIVTGSNKVRFRLDFNHIRQRLHPLACSGISVDKSKYDPSAIFRGTKLDRGDIKAKVELFEFMTIMPISTEWHSYISQDSAKGNITLANFNKKYWPWVLRSAANYNKFCKEYQIEGIEYDQFIDHLSNIDYDSLYNRLTYDNKTGKFGLIY